MTSVRTRLRMGLVGTGIIGATMLAAAAPAGAQPRTFTATLNGAQEVPPTGSPATGTGSMVFDAAAATLRELGSSSAVVITESSRTPAVATYRSAGFEQLPDRYDRRRT